MSLELKYNKEGKIYSFLGEKYKVATPEEIIRQKFVCVLVNNYKYDLAQMQEEVKTKHGKGSTRADIVIWQNSKDKQDSKTPLIVIECKADNIRIKQEDYEQGESYARLVNAPFFVTHNSYETRFWRVKKDKMPGYTQEIVNIPKNKDDEKAIKKLLDDLVEFKEDEFAKILHECHNYIRNIDKLAPSEAFDEISKILFMKVYIERKLLKEKDENIFSLSYIEGSKKYLKANQSILQQFFNDTKDYFKGDELFKDNDKINLKEATILKIVEKLQKYNLSLTSSDIKGVAFENFLGTTFRGNLGQFFTPRSVVEFMIDMIDPQENEIYCDPASGSGGFLIRIFNQVRELIQKDIKEKYESYKKELIGDKDEITAEQAQKLKDKFEELQSELNIEKQDSRLYKLSNSCIFGTDANDRMARTSKMNMIMHGDGHGGIHHHDGLLNVNGIFENRFDVILTNPPFGASVSKEDIIRSSDAQMFKDAMGELKPQDEKKEYIEKYYKLYGEEIYKNAQKKLVDNIGNPIASLFALKENLTSDKTEHLFINRCIDLLKPKGRMGIVLPEGVFNTPNAEYVRNFVERKAFIRAVISLPQQTFTSSGASVKCSILFLQKFSQEEQERWDFLLSKHNLDLEDSHKGKIDELNEIINYKKPKGEKEAKFSSEAKKDAKKKLKDLQEQIAKEALSRTKQDFNYPIFMAEAESVGITSTGETGENVPNDFIDKYEKSKNELGEEVEILAQKGIATHFKDFLKEQNIAWSKADERA